MPPGSELPLRGLDFFPGETLHVRLTGEDSPVDAGVVVAGADGHFEQTVRVPTALPAGLYTVDVISASGIIDRAVFTIDPAAAPASFEPLFAPAAGGGSSLDLTPLVALALAVAALGVLWSRTRPSRRVR